MTAAGASVVLHVGAWLVPSPSQAVQATARRELSVRVLPPPSEPEPEPIEVQEPEPEPSKPKERKREPLPPREPEPPPVEQAPAETPSEPDPVPAETEPPPEKPKFDKPVDLVLRPRWSDPNSIARRPRASGTGAPGIETEELPPGVKPRGGGRYVYENRGFTAEIDRDGTVRFKGKGAVRFQGSGISFDATEIALRASGDDPFHAEKVAFLENTAGFRSDLKREAEKEMLLEAKRDALARVERIWASSEPAIVRRQRLFDLWDSCVEEGEIERVDVGDFIRATVEGFVRRQLPRNSGDGFTDAELARLNANRTSRRAFEPYGP